MLGASLKALQVSRDRSVFIPLKTSCQEQMFLYLKPFLYSHTQIGTESQLQCSVAMLAKPYWKTE